MSSTNAVNYSIRPNKSVERSLVFDGARTIFDSLGVADPVYVGMGSVWFSDFHLAHRIIRAETMISVEADETTFRRATFNKPYSTVDVIEGNTADVLPSLLERPELRRPWMLWLDYDRALDSAKRTELSDLVKDLPPNSVMLTTFSATAGQYGTPTTRQKYLETLFGDVVPGGLTEDDLKEDLPKTLGVCTERYLFGAALDLARPGGYVPAFRLTYADGAQMTTVGGVLPSLDKERDVQAAVASPSWEGRPDAAIRVPHLTPKEASALQQLMPMRDASLTRLGVQKVGFDLDQNEIQGYQQNYLRYPTFAQLAD